MIKVGGPPDGIARLTGEATVVGIDALDVGTY